jgi:hypothetical protein
MSDPTEAARRMMVDEINSKVNTRTSLEAEHGQVWDTDEMTTEFQAVGFMAPFVVVNRRSDGVKGSLEFSHSPRFYFNFQEE